MPAPSSETTLAGHSSAGTGSERVLLCASEIDSGRVAALPVRRLKGNSDAR
jgi:hypothetical protein